jgi:pimeloyl-ACP methyl ester carboxylesterase
MKYSVNENALTLSIAAALTSLNNAVHAGDEAPTVRYGFEDVDGLKIFFREAGDPSKPAIVLLHGFPSSSHMYREVLRELSDSYYLIAPDYPGFGESSFPSPATFSYTFDNLAGVMDQFLSRRGLKKYSLMIQDYGAPVGFRIATAHPERVQAIITQNGNAYEEGIGAQAWGPVLDYWKHRSPELERTIIDNVFSREAIRWQYTHGTRDPESVSPDNWNLDYAKISREGQHRTQLDLFYDYRNNLKLYPQWQQYLRDYQPPVLVVWGGNDAFFTVPGAEGYQRDVEDIDYNILDTGHFALEEDYKVITAKMRQFLRARHI